MAPEIPFPADRREPRQTVRRRSGSWIVPDAEVAQDYRINGLRPPDSACFILPSAFPLAGASGFVPRRVKAGVDWCQ